MTAQEREIYQGAHVVDRVMMFGDAERPAELGSSGKRVCMRELANERGGHAGRLFRILDRVRFDAFTILVETAGRTRDEIAVLKACGENLTTDGVRQRDVRADVEAEPAVCPSRACRTSRIDDVKLGSVMNAAQNVMKEDRMRLTRVRSPKNDDVGLLDLLVRARSAASPKYRRQTDDAGGVSSSIAAIDVVAADDRTSELLRDIVHLVGSLRTAKHPVGARCAAIARVAQRGRRTVECLVPTRAAQAVAVAHQRMRQSKIGFTHAAVIRALGRGFHPKRAQGVPFASKWVACYAARARS